MPAASSEKRARQRANKLQRAEADATTSLNIPPPTQITEITSESLPTPAPTSFTVSYTPLLHPEPSASRSGTNAIQVTQFELNQMLRQAFQQGLEDSEQSYHLDLADAIMKLKMQYEDRHVETLNDFADRMQESNDVVFGEGFSAGIREERERWERVQVSKISVATQTVPTTTATSSISESTQTNFPCTPHSSSVSISTQTEPPIPTVSESIPIPIPSIPISEPPIPDTTSSAPFNWADDTSSLSNLPLIISKQPRDLSSLRSSSKNPFSSLRRRHHFSKRQKTLSSHCYTQSYPTHPPLHHAPPLLTNLDWHRDPRLLELSRVLRSLGWSHP